MTMDGAAVVVTGASQGLGRALATQLAERGAQVVLIARGREALEAVVAPLRARGLRAHALAGDVSNKEDIYRLSGAAAALVGPVDVLIHNASTLGPTPLPLLMDLECEQFEQVLQTNLVGPFRLTKALAGGMALRGKGLVVHLSSDAAVAAYPRWGAYSASKAALDHLARIWAAELEGTGVRFLGIDPGEMDTRMHADAMPEADPSTLPRPGDVARRIVAILEAAETLASGARLEAARFEAPPTLRTTQAAGVAG